jgi:hypothetical protein
MYLKLFDKKFRGGIFWRYKKKNSGGISANSCPEFRLLGIAELNDIKISWYRF